MKNILEKCKKNLLEKYKENQRIKTEKRKRIVRSKELLLSWIDGLIDWSTCYEYLTNDDAIKYTEDAYKIMVQCCFHEEEAIEEILEMYFGLVEDRSPIDLNQELRYVSF